MSDSRYIEYLTIKEDFWKMPYIGRRVNESYYSIFDHNGYYPSDDRDNHPEYSDNDIVINLKLEVKDEVIMSDKVKEVYFTGMFTSNQGDLSVHYYDPESGRIRQYYPDFLAKMSDDSYQLIEVKGDNKIDDAVVKAKQAAAEEMAVASGMKYLMYAGSKIMSTHILEDEHPATQVAYEYESGYGVQNAAEVDPVNEIRRYKSLLDDGIITQEEFEKKKQKLLSI